MNIPKELYIDSFNFIPLHRDSEDRVESFICDVFNNDIVGILFERGIRFFHKRPDDQVIFKSFYNVNNKRFNLSYGKVFSLLEEKFDVTIINKYNELCIPILNHHFKFKIERINIQNFEQNFTGMAFKM